MKILLATDGSVHSKETIEEITHRVFPPNTEVRIISAYQRTPLIMNIDPIGVSQEYYVEADNYALKLAEKATENAAKYLSAKDSTLTITTAVIEGSPKSVILEEAESFRADLIIVGSLGHGAVDRFLLGSVSLAVALHAKCSVEIVRTQIAQPMQNQ